MKEIKDVHSLNVAAKAIRSLYSESKDLAGIEEEATRVMRDTLYKHISRSLEQAFVFSIQ
jgi:hypothetical protein